MTRQLSHPWPHRNGCGREHARFVKPSAGLVRPISGDGDGKGRLSYNAELD